MKDIGQETEQSTCSDDKSEQSLIKSPELEVSTTADYYKGIILSRLVKALFCATPLSKIRMPHGLNPFSKHISLKNIKIKTRSKCRLGAWVVTNTKKPVCRWAIVLHGNSTNRYTFSYLYDVEKLIEDGIGAVIIDYRGFGDSEGSPGRSAFIEDMNATVRYLIRKGIKAASLIGYSLGTAIALEYLAKSYAISPPELIIDKLILISPFVSTVALLKEYKLWEIIESIIPESNNYAMYGLGFDSLKNIQSINISTLILHGTSDWLIPWHHSQMLSEASGATFIKVENETHNTIFKNPITWKAVSRFIQNNDTLISPSLIPLPPHFINTPLNTNQIDTSHDTNTSSEIFFSLPSNTSSGILSDTSTSLSNIVEEDIPSEDILDPSNTP
ncbi:hypothetical protein NEOKW01_1449 [Nematocida sp. AWRm80]|nr:hypothetical protein NEOKW01_1449 [Nematocida sp. AWRm80]